MNWQWFLYGACAPFVLMALFLCVSNIFKWCVNASLSADYKAMKDDVKWRMLDIEAEIFEINKKLKKKSR